MDIGLTILIVIASIVVLMLLVVTFFYLKTKKIRSPDYLAFFVMGVCWIPLGLITGNFAFTILGIVFATVGIIHQKRWKEKRVEWKDLDKTEKKFTGILFALLILFLIGIVCFFLFEKRIII